MYTENHTVTQEEHRDRVREERSTELQEKFKEVGVRVRALREWLELDLASLAKYSRGALSEDELRRIEEGSWPVEQYEVWHAKIWDTIRLFDVQPSWIWSGRVPPPMVGAGPIEDEDF